MKFYHSKNPISDQAKSTFELLMFDTHVLVDGIFSKILIAQWLFGILCAYFISPLAWSGTSSSVHIHLWSAILLGGAITCVPFAMTIIAPGRLATRLAVSTGQLMYSALLIHLLGGRIEAHFHIFMSLALLAAYRDRSVFIPAVAITLLDHIVRGFLWPQSIFGEYAIVSYRPFEHSAWVILETFSLCFIIGQALSQVASIAELQCGLQKKRDELESKVNERTQELNEARLFQERILDSIDAEICILDEHGEILFVNERWHTFCKENGGNELLTGAGANYLDICMRDDGPGKGQSPELAEAIEKVRDGKLDSFVGEYPCHWGNLKRWFHVRVSQVAIGRIKAVALVHIDISENRKAEARAASLAKLVLDSPDEVYIISKETLRFVEVNHGACQNLGYDRSTLLEMSPVDIKPDYCEASFLELLNDLLTEKSEKLDFETIHQRKDGSNYHCGISLHISMLEEEEVLVAFVTDLTHKKHLEAQLVQSQKLESVGQLAAGVAHEINTPMQCVFGNVEFLQKSFDGLLSLSDHVVSLLEETDLDWTKEREAIADLRKKYKYDFLRDQTPAAIQEASDASARVISIIRAMKIMSHPGSTDKSPTDLHDMIENAATITRSRWRHVAAIEFDFQPELENIEVLPSEISQVFINMIVNAGDAITQKLGNEPNELGKIKVATRIEGDWVKITFSDTGSGIPDHVKSRVFDPFFTTKEVGKGTGQGLSISRDVIVNRHSGTLDVESVDGEGTTFVIRIPRYPAQASPELENDTPVMPRLNSPTTTDMPIMT